jgi:hypothetical protein
MNPIHITSKSDSIPDIPVHVIGVFNVEDAKLAFGVMRYTMVVALNENTHTWHYFTNLKDCEEFFKITPGNF